MNRNERTVTPHRLVLRAEQAKELMTPNPVSLDQNVTVHDAAAFLTDHEFSAAPVIDAAGRPIGVLSRADIVRYERERTAHATSVPEFERRKEWTLPSGETLGEGFQVEVPERTTVTEIMTPVIISVQPTTPALEVVAKLVTMRLHRLFVVDETGVLVGIISTIDILRKLREQDA